MTGRDDGTGQAERQGIAFRLDGVDELTFARILNDLMHDEAFRKPLQVQATEPRAGQPGQLTLVFHPEASSQAVAAMQRLKTILLRHSVQVDSIVIPEGGA